MSQQSGCYPDCEEMYGIAGAPPHIHTIPMSDYFTGNSTTSVHKVSKKLEVQGFKEHNGIFTKRKLSTGLARHVAKPRIIRKSRLFGGTNLGSRKLNTWRPNNEKFDSMEKSRKTTIKAPLLKRNTRIIKTKKVFVYADTNTRYNGSRHYKAGNGQWYVDNELGHQQKLNEIKVKHTMSVGNSQGSDNTPLGRIIKVPKGQQIGGDFIPGETGWGGMDDAYIPAENEQQMEGGFWLFDTMVQNCPPGCQTQCNWLCATHDPPGQFDDNHHDQYGGSGCNLGGQCNCFCEYR